jgi:hypothetical protein
MCGESSLFFWSYYNSLLSKALAPSQINYSKEDSPEPPDPPVPPVTHTLVIVSPDTITGESGNIQALYDNVEVSPEWSVSPEGPTISDGEIYFTEDGVYTLQATYEGLVVTKSITLIYKAGWSTETVIDDSGDYPVATTTTTDDSGNIEQEKVAYIDGEPVNIGFDIEPADEDNPVVIDEGKDTKIYSFNGTNGFELFFKFHYDPSLQPVEDYTPKPGDNINYYTFLNMKYEVDPFPGLVIRHKSSDNGFIEISITPINPETQETIVTQPIKVNFTSDGIYDLYMRYEPSAPFEKFVILQNVNGEVKVLTKFDNYTFEFRNEITATLGYTNAGTVEEPIHCRQSTFDVYDFRLNKVMNPWKDVPCTTETESVGDFLITKEIINDTDIVKRLLIEPDPDKTSEEYACLEDGLVFNDIKPFIDKDQVFELEYDVKVNYEDQKIDGEYPDQFQVLINAISEPTNWPGLCIRLYPNGRPESTGSASPRGKFDTRLRYTNDKNVPKYTLAHGEYDIEEDYVIHYRYIYEGTATSICSAFYSYKTNRYVICTNKDLLYAVVPHDFPLCIGCGVDQNLQKFRICKMYIKKIEYVKRIK